MRRDTYDIVLLFKFKIGLVTANFDRFLVPVVPQFSTWNNYDPANFRLLSFHNQDNFTKLYFPKTIRAWNSLPHFIKYATSGQQFKSFLPAHYETRLSAYRPP